ncbi:MAG: hypothetical protein ACRDSN_09740 [Pseudonocardiaceae bacterium]
MFAHGVALTVHRATRDDFGDPGAETTHIIEGWALAPRLSSEPIETGRASVIVGLDAYGPYGADIQAADVVIPGAGAGRWTGVRFMVDGDPGDWRNPLTGWEAGTVAALLRVKG